MIEIRHPETNAPANHAISSIPTNVQNVSAIRYPHHTSACKSTPIPRIRFLPYLSARVPLGTSKIILVIIPIVYTMVASLSDNPIYHVKNNAQIGKDKLHEDKNLIAYAMI